MYINSKWHCMNDLKADRHNMITTKATSNSFDIDSHFALILQGIIGQTVKDIKANAFAKIANFNKNIQMPKQIMMFANHCATLIQSHFKGYQQRKYYLLFKPILHRFKELLIAVISGWRVRNIMKTNRIKKKCEKIKQQNNRRKFREARIIKRELIEDIALLQNKGNWLSYHEGANRGKQKSKITNIKVALRSKNSQNQSKQQTKSKISLKLKQKHESLQLNQQQLNYNLNTERKNHYNEHQQAPIKATGFYNIANQQNQDTFNLPTNSKLAGSASIKRKSNLQTKSKSKTKQNGKKQKVNKKEQQNQQMKKTVDVKLTEDQNNNTIKRQQLNSSNLIINLPIETVVFEDQSYIPNKTIKLSRVKQHNIHGEESKNQSGQQGKLGTQKLKKISKGIKVTLSTNEICNQNSENKKMESPCSKEKDELQEILIVYNNAYMNKSKQINQMMLAMKTQRKFVS